MDFKLSTNIGVESKNLKEAFEFYHKDLGFELINSNNNCITLFSKPITIYLQKDEEVAGVVLELFVENLEEAKNYLIKKGCRIIRWNGKNNDCYIEDPFGVIFNIWEKKKITD